MKDYYEIMQISKNASQEVIDKVYRILAKKYHPDLNQDNSVLAHKRMRDINEAYDVIGDPIKRERYDKIYSYEHNRLQWHYYKEQNNPAESIEKVSPKAERTAVVFVLGITAVFTIGFFLYVLVLNPLAEKYSIPVLSQNYSDRVFLINLPEARSQGLWKQGVNKSRRSRVLGEVYQNNLVQEFTISGFRNQRTDKEKNFCSVDYFLGGRYESLEGYVGVDDLSKNSELKGYVTVLGDGRVLYKSQSLIGGFKPKLINLDVRNIERLTIRFEAESPKFDALYFSDSIRVSFFKAMLKK